MHDLKMSLEARQVELKSRAAEAQTAENMLKDYERQLRGLHVTTSTTLSIHHLSNTYTFYEPVFQCLMLAD